MHDFGLLATLSVGLAVALVFGYVTQRLHLSPIIGYLLAGIAIGPSTPGFVGDQEIANQLAEIGVILLMFGVGLHFHLHDIIKVQSVAMQNAIEACIEIASHIVSADRLGAPKDHSSLFDLLEQHGILSAAMADLMRRMARFRNRIVHLYWDVDLNLVHDYLTCRLSSTPMPSRPPGATSSAGCGRS
jgi:uncharacterized protein YutE (UPF0331/DUF86 family)